MLISVLITNYNYSQFVAESIDSVLQQSYSPVEIVVVDDGSTDNSEEVILSYQDKIISVLKRNGGHTSALNAAFKACSGNVIFLLDSDDFFYPNKIQHVLDFMKEKCQRSLDEIAKQDLLFYHPLEVVDADGKSLGYQYPLKLNEHPANMYDYACKYKFLPFVTGPTTGIALTRQLAEKIFPLPDQTRLMSGEDFIVRPASLLGKVYSIKNAYATYRLHGNNDWFGQEYGKSKEWLLIHQDFLNKKLDDAGKKPVISFFDSIYSREYYEREGTRFSLMALAFRVVSHSPDLKTIRFSVKTIFLVLARLLSQI